MRERPPVPPPSCALPYSAYGDWTAATTAAARRCVLDGLRRDLGWWRDSACGGKPRLPALEATLCRVKGYSVRTMLTNFVLVRSHNGKLSAAILIDPGDPGGPMRHWPGRAIAALQQLAEMRRRIEEGALAPLPNFTAIVNPHD